MTVDELQVLITANTNELRKEMGKANKSISGLQKSATKSTSGVTNAFKKLKTGIVALGIGKIIKDSITSGMDAIESDSLFETSLGASADAVRSWSDEVSNTLGLNAVAMRKNTGVIYNMTTSMGLAEDNALKMSKGITLLSEDMASFYNLDSTEAFNKIRAGITGETEPLKALGILVDENTIKQVAYSEGIAENGAELTQQQKVLARYVAILKQTGNAQGDLARTINSPTNQLRILKQQVTNLGIALSSFFMPIINAVLPYITAFTKVVTQALTSLGKFLGFSGGGATSKETEKINADTQSISNNTESLASGFDDATKSAKKLKGSLAGFDEMNVLQDNSADDSSGASGGGGAVDGGTVGVGFDLSEYDAHLSTVKDKTSALVTDMTNMFSSLGEGVDFSNLTKAFGNLKTALGQLGTKAWSGLQWAFDNLLKPLAKFTIEQTIPSFINSISKALTGIGNMDYSGLQTGLILVRDSLLPFAENVGAGLDWFLQNVLVPLAGWVIEDIVPNFLNILSGAIDVVNQAMTDLQPIFQWFWDSVLQPIAKWTGGVISSVLNAIGDALKWIADNEVAMTIIESFALAIGLVSAALKIYNVVTTLAAVVSNALAVGINAINWPLVLIVAAIAAVIAIVTLLVKNWDKVKAAAEKVWNKIKEIWGVVANWINEKVVTPIKNFFTGLWDGIKNVFSSVGTWFKNVFTKAWDGIKSAFSKVKSFFTGIWDSIKEIFSKVGKVIGGAISGAVKKAVNTVLSLAVKIINGFISAINFAIGIINKIPGVEIKKLDKLEVPKMARGGIVDKPTIAMVGEAGKEAVMPLERNTGWIDQLANKLGDKLGGASGNIKLIVKLGEETIFDRFIEYGKEKAFETNGEVVFI